MTSGSSKMTGKAVGVIPAELEIEALAAGPVFHLKGDWTIETAQDADEQVSSLLAEPVRPNQLDLSQLGALDTSGAWIILRLMRSLHIPLEMVEGLSHEQKVLFVAVDETNHKEPELRKSLSGPKALLEALGRNVMEIYQDILILAHLMGGVVRGVFISLFNIRKLRITSIVHHIDQTGLQAVPIVALMSFLVGAIVAQQGAYQLRKFGAEPFVIDLVGILVLREVGVLLTAILVAGRSGSAFTAEIGSMRMREEIDALRVMGLNVSQVLITPRVLALVISLPLLGLVANVAALVGAGSLLWAYSGITIEAYISWLREAVAVNTFLVGLIKAPFMALIIALISCSEGLQVGGSAESLGRRTTAAVVKSIFLVVVVDGIFAIFFAAIGF
ncbi:MAG: ABC transporter permease [Cohaesibacter sp.]|jgi:phospholipid/cholesterol/gamma-HCH transport system permease protein|nr:ABC transporter permease [Cohaesibacter sp.]